jgi:hypothetical protein
MKVGGTTRLTSISMETASANSGKIASIEAIVYPPCECGEPWAKHGACGGYKPTGPVRNYGTLFFQSDDWLANTLFKVEHLFQRLRVARLRRL